MSMDAISFSTALVSSGELAVANYTVPGLRFCRNQIASR
jgi:hypothetical protein